MAKVFVIMGRTGKWDEACEWVVSAYSTEVGAIACVERLMKWCEERGLDREHNMPLSEIYAHGKPNDDPHFVCCTTGTDYYYFGVDLND